MESESRVMEELELTDEDVEGSGNNADIEDNKLVCKICRKECNEIKNLSNHISQGHKIKIKDYYDKYFKKENEGKCLECGKETKFSGFRGKYSKFCSPKCSNNNKEIKEKIKQIFLKKYGVLYPTQNKKIIEKREQLNKIKNIKNPNRVEKIKEKIKQTFLEKYGVINPSQSEEIKEKKKQTYLKNFGVINPSQSEKIKEKKKQTCLKNFGTKHPFQCEKIREKSKHSFLKKYNVEHPSQTKEFQEKIKQTCLEKYGVEHPNQSKEIKEKKKQTCLEKYGVEHPSQIKEFQEKKKQTRIKNGIQIPDDQLSYFRIYYREILHFTNLSLKKKYNKEELEKRKLCGTDGGLQVDHKFSIMEGFKQNILPCIIGSQSNLELLLWQDNLKKYNKCSIAKRRTF